MGGLVSDTEDEVEENMPGSQAKSWVKAVRSKGNVWRGTLRSESLQAIGPGSAEC